MATRAARSSSLLAPLLTLHTYRVPRCSSSSRCACEVRQLERICLGWRLRPVADALICRNGQPQTAAAILRPGKTCPPDATARCEELGGLLAATLLL